MICKGCGEELRYWDYIALSMCKTCYVIDDMDRFKEYDPPRNFGERADDYPDGWLGDGGDDE